MTTLMLTTILLALAVVVLLVLYLRALKTIRDDKSVLNESKDFNRSLIQTLTELNTENKVLRGLLDNKNNSK